MSAIALLSLHPSRLCVALVRCPPSEKKTASHPSAVPVILISIDTLRADHLPGLGLSRGRHAQPRSLSGRLHPFRQRLESHPHDATLASDHAHGTSPVPAWSSQQHRLSLSPGESCESSSASSAAGIRHRRGGLVIRAGGESGLRDCFQFYDDAINPRPGAPFDEYQRAGSETAAIAERWIDSHSSRPFFFFLHIYEPHVPYAPPEPYRSRYRSAYDGEIATADAIIGEFLDHLRSTGIYDKALIVITSDHGEGLGRSRRRTAFDPSLP